MAALMILRTTAFLLTSAALQAVPLTKLPDGPYLFPATVADTPHAVGNYAGSIYGYGEDGLPGRVARGGFDSFRLGKGGSYSGRGRIDGAVFSLKGKFSPEDGQSTAQVALKGTSAVSLSLALAKGDDGSVRITGVLTGLAGSLPLAIDLAASNHGDEAVRSVGRYTAYFPPFAADAVQPQPMGAGVATMTVDGKGVLRCQYILPDGTQGTRSGALAGLGVWQFYFPAGGSAAVRGGLLAGHVNFWRIAHGPDFWNDLEGVISWKMPANPRPGATPFPAGFDVQRKVSGKRYVPEYKGDPGWYELESGVANAYLTTGPGSVTPAAEVGGSAESGGGVKQVAAIGG
ncbi:MAG: hypothetical protein JWO82_3103, partial [Akkermansiaceae bacterium]|nr:hypothetical protein [Akkermansiaceae bacterium]